MPLEANGFAITAKCSTVGLSFAELLLLPHRQSSALFMKTTAHVALLVLATLTGLVTRATAAVEVGQAAPDFTLTDIDGHAHSLADYRGKVVVLEWNNPDCPIVRKHYDSDNLPKLQREATADGVIWLLINSGAPGKEGGDYSAVQLKDWLKGHNAAPTAYLRDQDGKVGHLYHARTTPHMFVINKDGTLMYEGAIDSIASARKSDIAKATNYVRVALTDLKDGKPIEKKASEPYGCSVKYGSSE